MLTSLITGANGFIGSTMAEYLLARGHKVVCLVRKTSDLTNLLGLEVEYRYGDISHPESLPSALEGIDYVFHFAGLTKAKSASDYFNVNGHGVRNLAESAVKTGISKIIYCSSLAALGPQTNSHLLHEEMAPRPVTIYGESKLLGEVFLRNICANKIFWTIIRPGGVYGPKDKDIFLYFKAINRGWKILPSGKKRIIPLIHAQDLAELCYSAAEKSASGEIYLATDSGTHTWVSVADAIARILNKKGVRIVIPLTITSAVAFASELRGKLQGKLSPLNREKLKELRANWGASMAKAQHILNFKSAFTLEAGLRNTVEWYLAHGWLRP